MPKQYYKTLIITFIISITFPVYYFFHLTKNVPYNEVEFTETQYNMVTVAHPIQPIPNQVTIDSEWVIVGKALFHSPLLSKNNTISCASCHQVDFGGDDGFSVSTGVNNSKGVRNSPTVLNSVFNFRQFWDGSASTLAEQIAGPIHNPIEMASQWSQVTSKINSDNYFSKAFTNLGINKITANDITKAITIYEESLITPNAPIDLYLQGDINALNPQQIRGLEKFLSFGCVTCHQGRNIGGNIYQRLGRINNIPDKLQDDLGRFTITNQEHDRFVFKVPSLRNIAETAPYFHNGSVNTLEEAVTIMAKVQLGRVLTEGDVQDLVTLLESFSAPTIELVNNEKN